jgi:hypothetical protein
LQDRMRTLRLHTPVRNPFPFCFLKQANMKLSG